MQTTLTQTGKMMFIQKMLKYRVYIVDKVLSHKFKKK